MSASELGIIVLKAGGGLVGSFVHASTRVTIGSGPACDVVIDEPNVAAEHAAVVFTGRSCVIEAVGGAPLYANGEAVDSHLVQPQDTIGIGTHTLRFVVHRAVQAPNVPVTSTARAPTAATPHVKAPAPKAPAAAPIVEQEAAPDEADRTVVMALPKIVPKLAAVPNVAPAKAVAQPQGQTEPTPVEIKPAAAKKAKAAEPRRAPTSEREEVTKVIEVAKKRDGESVGTLALAPTARDDDDDDDEDEDFVPFSLVEALQSAAKVTDKGHLAVEAISQRDGRVHRITHVWPGASLRLPPPTSLQCKLEPNGQLVIKSASKLSGRATRNGAVMSFHSLMKGDEVHVDPGIVVELFLNDYDSILFQHVAKVELNAPTKAGIKKPSKEQATSIGASIAVHLLAFLAVGLLSARSEVSDTNNEGRFVEVQIKDMELEAPPPKQPELVPIKDTTPQPPAPKAKQAKAAPTPKAAPTQAAPQAAAPPRKSAAASNLLAALGGPAPSATSNALAAATNLDAVAAPRGSGFKVSGVIGKMPGNELRLGAAGSGVGRVDTKSATELTNGGALGRVQGSAPSGKVRGVVEGPPPRSVTIQGQLDRGEIQKVVNDHLHEVQGCYERQLVKDPSLAGKIVSEWIITPAGTVGSVKIKSSSVRNNEVANCIQAALKRWKFPQPKGGPVTVTYPFVFSTIGM